MENNKTYAIGIDDNGIKYIFNITILYTIWCDNKNLISLIVYDENNQLKCLYCHYNILENITIIGGKNIAYIWCYNNKLKEFDLSMCKKLEYLECDIELENTLILPNHQLNYIYYE